MGHAGFVFDENARQMEIMCLKGQEKKTVVNNSFPVVPFITAITQLLFLDGKKMSTYDG